MRQCGKTEAGRQATDDNMVHEHCLLDTYVYIHILRICNTYCFSTATIFDVLLTVHLSIFISVFNQLDALLFHNKFYFMPLHVSSTCAHHQEVKIALHSLWYHHTYRVM